MLGIGSKYAAAKGVMTGLSKWDIGVTASAAAAGSYGILKANYGSYYGANGIMQNSINERDLAYDMSIRGGNLGNTSFLSHVRPTSPIERAVHNVQEFSNVGVPGLVGATVAGGVVQGGAMGLLTNRTLETLLPKVPKKYLPFNKNLYDYNDKMSIAKIKHTYSHAFDRGAPIDLTKPKPGFLKDAYDLVDDRLGGGPVKPGSSIVPYNPRGSVDPKLQTMINGAPYGTSGEKTYRTASSAWAQKPQHRLAKTLGRGIIKWGGTVLAAGMGIRSAYKGAMKLSEGFFNTIDNSIRQTYGVQSGLVDRRNTRAGGGTRSWTKPTLGKRMQPNNLASGGDLVIAMHRIRHKSMI